MTTSALPMGHVPRRALVRMLEIVIATAGVIATAPAFVASAPIRASVLAVVRAEAANAMLRAPTIQTPSSISAVTVSVISVIANAAPIPTLPLAMTPAAELAVAATSRWSRQE